MKREEIEKRMSPTWDFWSHKLCRAGSYFKIQKAKIVISALHFEYEYMIKGLCMSESHPCLNTNPTKD